jgi:hypothetical protein
MDDERRILLMKLNDVVCWLVHSYASDRSRLVK